MMIVGAVVLTAAAACSSTKGLSVGPAASTTSSVTTSTSTSIAVAVAGARGDALTFREVLGNLPYHGQLLSPSATTLPSASGTSCGDGALVTPRAQQTAGNTIVLPDRGKSACYLLGPVLLTGHNIVTADPLRDPTSNSWIINLHFANDDFVNKVAVPYVSKQIAIVLDGVVESAPTINQGITGQDVTISATFDEATARHIAAGIAPLTTEP